MGFRTPSRRLTALPDWSAVRPRVLPALWVAMACVVAAEAIGELLAPQGLAVEFIFHDWLHDIGGGLAALMCVCGVVVGRRNRVAWGAIAAAVTVFATGQVLWSLLYRHQPPRPTPNVTDAFYLAFYPCAIGGLVLLTRARVPRFEFHRWIDGILIALMVAAAGVALVFVPVAEHSTGHVFADAVNFAYPLLDVLLVGAVLGVFAITDWRPGRSWAWLGVGFLLMAIPDSVATVQRLHGGVPGVHRPYHLERYDFLWTLGMVAIAYAAWVRAPGPLPAERSTGWRAIALPLAAQALAVTGEIVGFFHEIPAGGRPLMLIVLLLGMVQIYVSRPRRGEVEEAHRIVQVVEELAAERIAAADAVAEVAVEVAEAEAEATPSRRAGVGRRLGDDEEC